MTLCELLGMNELLELKKRLESELAHVNAVIEISNKRKVMPSLTEEVNNTSNAYSNWASKEEIKQIILGITGNFKKEDAQRAVIKKLPEKVGYSDSSVSAALYELSQNEGKLQIVEPRSGRKPAIYCVKGHTNN